MTTTMMIQGYLRYRKGSFLLVLPKKLTEIHSDLKRANEAAFVETPLNYVWVSGWAYICLLPVLYYTVVSDLKTGVNFSSVNSFLVGKCTVYCEINVDQLVYLEPLSCGQCLSLSSLNIKRYGLLFRKSNPRAAVQTICLRCREEGRRRVASLIASNRKFQPTS